MTTKRPVLTIDPALQFGDVCIANTRVPASAVAGCVVAGDDVNSTAENYEVTREDVLLACWYITDQAVRTPKSHRVKIERQLANQWSKWADEVFPALAGYEGAEKPSDPPELKR